MDKGFTPQDYDYFEKFLKNFEDLRPRTDTETVVRCTDPEGRHSNGDTDPSLSIGLSQNGRGPAILLNCLSQGCDKEKILAEVGLGLKDLYPSGVCATKNSSAKSRSASSARDKVEVPGCSLEAYAAYKKLPIEFLTGDEVALEETTYTGKPAVLIPYADREGNVVLHRFRTGLKKPKKGPDTRIRNEKGKSPILYGLHRIDEAEKAGYVLLVEGESDTHTAWFHQIPALGIPGVENWKDEWAEELSEIPKILVPVEDDKAGESLWEAISRCKALSGKVVRIGVDHAL